MTEEKQLFTLEEAAEFLGLSKLTTKKYVYDSRQLHPVFTREELIDFRRWQRGQIGKKGKKDTSRRRQAYTPIQLNSQVRQLKQDFLRLKKRIDRLEVSDD